jgi:catechol 2,3-dioxygenase-like lactoylglutathione lyase family enzyme
MLASARLMAFVASADPARAREFYEAVLGLSFVADEPYALIFDCQGTPLRVQKVAEVTPPAGTALGWVVADVAAVVDGLAARGVIFERFPGFGQDERGVLAFADGAQVAWFKDPDGNLLSLTQLPSS